MTGHNTPETREGIHENDVLLGRGGQTNKHMGNERFRSIVMDHQSEYLRARKKDKVLISRRIVAIVHQNGGRFLKQMVSSEWKEVPDKRAQEKTSQALREGLDVRNQVLRKSKVPRRDSASSSSDSPPRKKFKTTYCSQPADKMSPSLVSVDGHCADFLFEEIQRKSLPSSISFLPYQRQLSKSDVTDACAV